MAIQAVNSNDRQKKAFPEKLIADPIVEKAIRQELKKFEGKLTEADLEMSLTFT